MRQENIGSVLVSTSAYFLVETFKAVEAVGNRIYVIRTVTVPSEGTEKGTRVVFFCFERPFRDGII